jgi:pantothenate kinase
VLEDLVARIDALRATTPRPVLIGIAGAPGAGKTTLAEELVGRLGAGAVHVPMDGFHLADVELVRLGRSDRKGAPDTFDPGGYASLLARIRTGEAVWAPGFERTLDQPIAQSIFVAANVSVVVSEGNYLLLPEPTWQRVRSLFTEVWFVRADDEARVERLIARHAAFGKSPQAAREWVQRSDERNATLVAATAASADLVIDL